MDVVTRSLEEQDSPSQRVDVWHASQMLKKHRVFERASEWSREKANAASSSKKIQLSDECSMSETIFLSSKAREGGS